jgi:hypothetical protein
VACVCKTIIFHGLAEHLGEVVSLLGHGIDHAGSLRKQSSDDEVDVQSMQIRVMLAVAHEHNRLASLVHHGQRSTNLSRNNVKPL